MQDFLIRRRTSAAKRECMPSKYAAMAQALLS